MKIIVRNFIGTLKRYSTSSIINIIGLALAFAAFYIIMVQVDFDITYNKRLPDSNRIYRIEYSSAINSSNYMHWMNRPMGDAIVNSTPLIETGGAESWRFERAITIGHDSNLHEVVVKCSEMTMSLLIDIYGATAAAGDLQELKNPNTVAFSKQKADELGLELGDRVYLNSQDLENAHTVVAIFNNFARNTEMGKIEAIVDLANKDITTVGRSSYCHYIKLQPNTLPSQLEAPIYESFTDLLARSGMSPEAIEQFLSERSIRLLPLTQSYFANNVDNNIGEMGNRWTCYSLLSIAILVIIIALINFINFFFALVPVRIKTVNTYKIFGSPISQLRQSLIFEAFAIVTFALLLAVLLVILIKTSAVSGYISSPLDFSMNGRVVIITILSALAIAFLGSAYPSRYITSFPTAMVIKGSFSGSKAGQKLRYALVGFQFIISISLIICTTTIRLQQRYMMNYNMGFNHDRLLCTSLPAVFNSTTSTRNSFTSRLLQSPNITDVTWSASPIVDESRDVWESDHNNKRISFQTNEVAWNFLQFMGIEVIEGRNFSMADESKPTSTFIFNSRGKAEYDLALDDMITRQKYQVVGFCNDFNFKPLQYGITPMALRIGGNECERLKHLYVRIAPNSDITEAITTIKNTITDFIPNVNTNTISVDVFDAELGSQYQKEQRLSTFIALFSLLSVVISLMGVFGLVLFETQHRRKEIGIRRVHGATIPEILAMFNTKFVAIILVCFVVSAPISYYISSWWLNSFAYRTPIFWWVFVLALLVILAITITTVTTRSLKAATSNPATSIKTE